MDSHLNIFSPLFRQVGKAKVLCSTGKDQCLVIAAGVTLEQALNAAKDLESFSGISVRVMDPFTVSDCERLINFTK